MLDVSALQSFYPFVATPCYGGVACRNYVISIINFIRASQEVGMPVDFHVRSGDSLVTRARNDCVAEFLSHDHYTHLFWIDADIGFTPEAAMRLFLSGHDIAAGAYPLKRHEWPQGGLPQGLADRSDFNDACARYTVNAIDEGNKEVDINIDEDGFIKVLDAPTGFMLIKREVFFKLIEAYPDYKYTPDWPEGTYPEGGVHYRFFDTMVDPESRRYLSEDYAFCRLLQNLGIDIYVDANSNLTHQGETTYTGNFGRTLTSAPAHAIGATKGKRMNVVGSGHLKPNPRLS